ncbi:thiamine-phosphate kinase [Anaerobacillus sp. MEB173]|uniref:thiamine-phosphate kinase n=1 Tax=Anaerobacillus sp. MEB173 TaxID=3383345 RepID=UPI003F8FCAB5
MIKDEFEFIQSITPKKTFQSSLIKGIGDDAALFQGDNRFDEIVCMDTMVEGIHFASQTMRPYDIGYKVLASNISDIAAMGGVPTYYLVSIAIPPHWQVEDLRQIYNGMSDLARQYHVDLIGGDTVSTKDVLVITITVLGRVEGQRQLLRSNAKPDDVVFITGYVGESAAGLQLLLDNDKDYDYNELEQQLIRAHQTPIPQIKEGRILAGKEVRVSLNDISDGVASEAYEIAEASQVSIVLESDALPRSKALRLFSDEQQLKWILNGGEDFKLIGTVSAEQWESIKDDFAIQGLEIFKVGIVKEGPANVYLIQDGQTTRLNKAGYNHFKRNGDR